MSVIDSIFERLHVLEQYCIPYEILTVKMIEVSDKITYLECFHREIQAPGSAIRRPLGRRVRTVAGGRFTSLPSPPPLDTVLRLPADASQK